jgi:hypothetical protein
MGWVVNRLLSGDDFDYQCHSNLVRAVLPYGLTEADVHDVLNVFQVTGLNRDGKYFMFVPAIFTSILDKGSELTRRIGNLHPPNQVIASPSSLRRTCCVQ